MKVKTSITLSSDLLRAFKDIEAEFKNRSAAIERAILFFIQKRQEQKREEKDLKILNKKAKRLNEEAEDVLSYQVDL